MKIKTFFVGLISAASVHCATATQALSAPVRKASTSLDSEFNTVQAIDLQSQGLPEPMRSVLSKGAHALFEHCAQLDFDHKLSFNADEPQVPEAEIQSQCALLKSTRPQVDCVLDLAPDIVKVLNSNLLKTGQPNLPLSLVCKIHPSLPALSASVSGTAKWDPKAKEVLDLVSGQFQSTKALDSESLKHINQSKAITLSGAAVPVQQAVNNASATSGQAVQGSTPDMIIIREQ